MTSALPGGARDAAMHPTEALLVHEKVEGAGKVHDGERLLTEVDYSLKDVEELHATSDGIAHDTPTMSVGVRNIYGILVATREDELAASVGARRTLRLQDGRRLEFAVAKVLGGHRFLILGLDVFR